MALTGIVQNELKADPLSAAIFIFLNRRRNQVKLLLWEGMDFLYTISGWKKAAMNFLPAVTGNSPLL